MPTGSARILQTQTDKCSPRVVEHVHYHNKQNQQTSQASAIFHIHIVEEAYCPSHQRQQLEAAGRHNVRK